MRARVSIPNQPSPTHSWTVALLGCFRSSGAARGLGREITRVLYSRGAHVVLTARTKQQAEVAANQIRAEDAASTAAGKAPIGRQITAMECDLASLTSVRNFAYEFKATGLPLHVLINNGAVMSCDFTMSADGHELQVR
eukprot:1194408-Prorocentrum_minimum.AAC.4